MFTAFGDGQFPPINLGGYIKEEGKLRRTYLIYVIDDHSRLIVGARFFFNDNAYNFQLVLKDAIARYGLCKKLYLDN